MDQKFSIAEINAIVVPNTLAAGFLPTQDAKIGYVFKLYILLSLQAR